MYALKEVPGAAEAEALRRQRSAERDAVAAELGGDLQAAAQLLQDHTQHSRMRNHRNRPAVEEMIHFPEDPRFKSVELFSPWRRMVRIAGSPVAGVLRMSVLNLRPAQAFPLTEINLAQCRTKRQRNAPGRGNRLRRTLGALQVAAIDSLNRLCGE